jgi:hypothetical protein
MAMKFTYASGQKPLEGYTLKRGIGRGGFGEVYFALSDGGKEVALKLLRGNGPRDIELRGVVQCLNLKHPNLVALYDLRTDAHGDHWVVMEYVAGEPLSIVLQRHANGLPRELAREWFLGLAKAITYLHDHGIVHRDLKPGNVFLENGMVKVGDYGLSKSISTSQRHPQTQSVGTVHYMAPEISTGNYNKQIDVYAAGIVLYEMLTGHVPFEGESAAEILMKHLTTPPDLSRLPSEYVPIVAKALAKNPTQRYASMAEMARAVESVGEPRAAVPAPAPVPTPLAVAHTPELIPNPSPITIRGQVAELFASMLMAVLFAFVGTTLWATLTQIHAGDILRMVFFLTVASSWAVLIPSKFWSGQRGDPWRRRVVLLVFGSLVGVMALWLDGGSSVPFTEGRTWGPPVLRESRHPVDEAPLGTLLPGSVFHAAGYLIYFGLVFFALRLWRATERQRAARFSLFPILAVGFWALILLPIVGEPLWRGAVALVQTAAIVQLVSPWEQPPARAARRLRLRYV